MLSEAAAMVAEALEAEWAAVLTPRNGLRVTAAHGDGGVPRGIENVARLALESDEPVLSPDLAADRRLGHDGSVAGSGVATAIPGRERPYGVLVACSPRTGAFGDEDAEFLRSAASVLSEALHAASAVEEQRRLTAALESVRSRLQAVIESLPAGVVLAELPSGRITLANQRAAAVLHRPHTPHTAFGIVPPRHSFHPDGTPYRADELPLVRSMVHGEVVTGEEIETVLGDETRATLSFSSAPVRDLLGEIVGGVATFFDVSRQKSEQESLRLHQTLLEAQGQASIEGILVVSPEGRMISFNRRFVEMWGLSQEVLQSGSDEDALEAVHDQLVDPEAFLARVRYLYEHPDEHSSEEIELVGGRTFDRYSAPLTGEGGARYGRIWFFRDITERKRAEERQRFLAVTSAALEAALDLPTAASSLADACVPYLADFCEVDVISPDGELERMAGRAADRAPAGRAAPVELAPIDPAGHHPVAVAIRTGELVTFDAPPGPAIIGDQDAELVQRLGIRGGVVAPLRARGRTRGALFLGHAGTGARSALELDLVTELAQRAALTIDNVLLYEGQRHIAETLQRSLLPEDLPQPPGLALAARYVPGGRGTEVGGDWYDAIPLPSGGTALVIGDVVGRGVRAASVMGHLRNVARVYALDETPPARAAAAMNRLVETLGHGEMATMLYAVLDHDLSTLRVSSAGHPPPLLIHPGGRTEYVEGGRSLPFGALSHAVYDEASCRIEPGSTLLLYTDGLIERRGEPLQEGLARLAGVAAQADGELQGFCDRVLSALSEGQEPSDDVALLAVRIVPVDAGALQLRLPADAVALASLRHALGRWLRRAGADEQETFEILFACNEACANAIEHAYGLEEGSFDVEVHLEGDEVVAVIRDFGRWRRRRGADRGRGLRLMERMMDSAEVRRDDQGTEVRLRRRLRAKASR